MSTRITARVEHRLEATAEEVYDAWLDPEVVRAWMGAALKTMGLPGTVTTVEVDPRVGGGFTFADQRPEGEARHWGTYLELVRPERLRFTWITEVSTDDDPSVVTVTIRPEIRGCVAAVEHEMSDRWREHVDKAESGWSAMLSAIGEAIRCRTPCAENEQGSAR